VSRSHRTVDPTNSRRRSTSPRKASTWSNSSTESCLHHPLTKAKSASRPFNCSYYRCPLYAYRIVAGPAPKLSTTLPDDVESDVWNAVLRVLTDPDRLQADLEQLIEQESWRLRGNPEGEVGTWLERLMETDHTCDAHINLAADGIMSREELKVKLAQLDDSSDRRK
jgi:hypothetical protein